MEFANVAYILLGALISAIIIPLIKAIFKTKEEGLKKDIEEIEIHSKEKEDALKRDIIDMKRDLKLASSELSDCKNNIKHMEEKNTECRERCREGFRRSEAKSQENEKKISVIYERHHEIKREILEVKTENDCEARIELKRKEE